MGWYGTAPIASDINVDINVDLISIGVVKIGITCVKVLCDVHLSA
jgi:hypothetical protein